MTRHSQLHRRVSDSLHLLGPVLYGPAGICRLNNKQYSKLVGFDSYGFQKYFH